MKPGPFFKWTAECCATNLAIFRHPAGWSRQVKTLWPGPFWGFNPPILFRRWVGCETQPIARVPRPPSSVKTLGMGKSFKINLSICSRFNDAFLFWASVQTKMPFPVAKIHHPLQTTAKKKTVDPTTNPTASEIWGQVLWGCSLASYESSGLVMWKTMCGLTVEFCEKNKTLDSSVMKLCICIYIYMDKKGSFLFMNC